MSFITAPARPRMEHHSQVAWPTTVVTFDELERHLRRLTRLPCGCFQYGGFRNSRPTTRIFLTDGFSYETPVARVMAMLSADRPLGEHDRATHQCDNPICANPDHISIGSHGSNMRDRSNPGRPIEERLDARFYDLHLDKIAATPPRPLVLLPKTGRPIGYVPDNLMRVQANALLRAA